MGSIGVPELIVIFIVALLVFGPRKLPEIGKSMGKALKEFQRARNELISTVKEEVRKIETETSIPSSSTTSPPAISNTTTESKPETYRTDQAGPTI
jgi:sec-independent protein translocase protein TatA